MITELLSKEQESEAVINLIVRADEWGVQLDCHITPLFCLSCQTQLEHLYKLDGGRYGQVGTVKCKCGAEIHCADSDNIVEYLNTLTTLENKKLGEYSIDFKKVYRLESPSWTLLKEKLGYDILKEHRRKTLSLDDLLNELIGSFNIRLDNSKKYSSDKFHKLPESINKWFNLLEDIDK